jgi:hypothetical protein
MDFQNKNNDAIFTRKVGGGRIRTYYIDVKKTRNADHYIVLTENTKRLEDNGIDRHKIFIYKEDVNKFLAAFNEAAAKVKELSPNFDFDYKKENQKEEEEG